MTSPVRDSSLSTPTSIRVTWTASTSTGDSAITSYNLQWDAGTGTTWFDLQGQDGFETTQTWFLKSDSITAGNTY